MDEHNPYDTETEYEYVFEESPPREAWWEFYDSYNNTHVFRVRCSNDVGWTVGFVCCGEHDRIRPKRKVVQTFFALDDGRICDAAEHGGELRARRDGLPIGHRYEGERDIEWEDE